MSQQNNDESERNGGVSSPGETLGEKLADREEEDTVTSDVTPPPPGFNSNSNPISTPKSGLKSKSHSKGLSKKARLHLTPEIKFDLANICVEFKANHKRLNKTMFWKMITDKLMERRNVELRDPQSAMKGLVRNRKAVLQNREVMGGDRVEILKGESEFTKNLDVWIEHEAELEQSISKRSRRRRHTEPQPSIMMNIGTRGQKRPFSEANLELENGHNDDVSGDGGLKGDGVEGGLGESSDRESPYLQLRHESSALESVAQRRCFRKVQAQADVQMELQAEPEPEPREAEAEAEAEEDEEGEDIKNNFLKNTEMMVGAINRLGQNILQAASQFTDTMCQQLQQQQLINQQLQQLQQSQPSQLPQLPQLPQPPQPPQLEQESNQEIQSILKSQASEMREIKTLLHKQSEENKTIMDLLREQLGS